MDIGKLRKFQEIKDKFKKTYGIRSVEDDLLKHLYDEIFN